MKIIDFMKINIVKLFKPIILVAICYTLLTIVFWGAFVLDRGLHAETKWIELSQERPSLEGFIYPDKDRLFMSLPFHIAYIFSDGSYLSLHILFGIFVFLTGFLSYLIMRHFFPGNIFLNFLIGAVTLVFGADMAVVLLPMIVVRQAIVFMLAAFLIFLIAWKKQKPALLLVVATAQLISLWTYEVGLLMMLCAPLLIWEKGINWRKWWMWAFAWNIVPALKVAYMGYRYLIQQEVSYQSAQLFSADWSIINIPIRMFRFVYDGLLFWNWSEDWLGPFSEGCTSTMVNKISIPLIIGVVGFAVAIFLINKFQSSEGKIPVNKILLFATIFSILAYLPFLPLGQIHPFFKMNWRTHFYPAFPMAVILIIALYQIGLMLRTRWILFIGSILIIVSGLFSGMANQLEQDNFWARHQNVMSAIVRQAPNIKDDTLVVLTNIPDKLLYSVCENYPPTNPFGSPMWFNSALQVYYPNTRLIGLYTYEGAIMPEADFKFNFNKNGVELERTSIRLEGKDFGYDQMIAFEFDSQKGATLLASDFPSADVLGSINHSDYNPIKRIDFNPPPIETIRKLDIDKEIFIGVSEECYDETNMEKRINMLDWGGDNVLRESLGVNFYGILPLNREGSLTMKENHLYFLTKDDKDHLTTPFLPLQNLESGEKYITLVSAWYGDWSIKEIMSTKGKSAALMMLQDKNFNTLVEAQPSGQSLTRLPEGKYTLCAPVSAKTEDVRVVFKGKSGKEVIMPDRIMIEHVRLKK
ncbi:MAG: hypothetical protein US71_C0003G0032 [Parcubacteria group bacterium GW2011_GWD2_38_12]|nr:MAG: hypothetical protein US71_C0003G0032 [Parcubacteria group bacterium GW2011_GWD2_38_12]KKQ58362.1 MAG: hypothetical protein US79_C0009G0036 [Parcubacteria group bacterium GW2011_GWC1_38_17]